jgi:hypothetical protein
MRAATYRTVVDTLLLIALSAILALVVWSWASDSPTRQDVLDRIDGLQQQVTILNCQINADHPFQAAECVEFLNDNNEER